MFCKFNWTDFDSQSVLEDTDSLLENMRQERDLLRSQVNLALLLLYSSATVCKSFMFSSIWCSILFETTVLELQVQDLNEQRHLKTDADDEMMVAFSKKVDEWKVCYPIFYHLRIRNIDL